MLKVAQPISVLHILSSVEISGGERYIFDLINHSDTNIRHILILPYKGPFSKVLDFHNIGYSIIPIKKLLSLKSLLKIIKIINNEKITTIHTHGYRANLYGRIAGVFTKKKNVTTIHVSLFDYVDTPILIKFLYLLVEKIFSNLTSKFICISNAMKNDLLRLKISSNKIVPIPNGVDLEKFHPRPNNQETLKEFSLQSKKIFIGTVGRMVNEKGQMYLLDALNMIKYDFPDLQCLFIGKGPNLETLKNRTKELGLEKNCKFLGIHRNVEHFYPILDVFVLPSIREPFGLSLMEAMASRIPVIATEGGGPSEFIVSGHNGILVPPRNSEKLAESIKLLLNNHNLANSIAREGLFTVESKFTIKKSVQNTCNVYYSL